MEGILSWDGPTQCDEAPLITESTSASFDFDLWTHLDMSESEPFFDPTALIIPTTNIVPPASPPPPPAPVAAPKPVASHKQQVPRITHEGAHTMRLLIDGIPRRGGGDSNYDKYDCVKPVSPTTMSKIETSATPELHRLISAGYDLRLGESGRSYLKRELSQQFRLNPKIRDQYAFCRSILICSLISCARVVGRLKSANVHELIAMSEIAGIFPLVSYM